MFCDGVVFCSLVFELVALFVLIDLLLMFKDINFLFKAVTVVGEIDSSSEKFGKLPSYSPRSSVDIVVLRRRDDVQRDG